MTAEDRLHAEIRVLRAELQRVALSNRALARMFVTYMNQAGLDRPERVKRAKLLAAMGDTILGGHEVEDRDLEECAAVGRSDIAGFFASGVLAVSPRLVLTAAHCGPPVSTLPTQVALDLRNLKDVDASKIRNGDFEPYPGYVADGPHDIAAMVLTEDAPVAPVDLASTAELLAAEQVTLAGFGDNNAAGTTGFGVKRRVTVPIRFLRGAASDRPENPMARLAFDKDLEFVAGVDGAGACLGDSGGPAYIDTPNGRKLAGITSRTPATNGPLCGGIVILTRVDIHRDWILTQVPKP